MNFAKLKAIHLIAHLHVKKWFRDEATVFSTNVTVPKKQRSANARTMTMNLAMPYVKICRQVLLDSVWMISVTVLHELQLLPRFFSNAHSYSHTPSTWCCKYFSSSLTATATTITAAISLVF